MKRSPEADALWAELQRRVSERHALRVRASRTRRAPEDAAAAKAELARRADLRGEALNELEDRLRAACGAPTRAEQWRERVARSEEREAEREGRLRAAAEARRERRERLARDRDAGRREGRRGVDR